MIELALASLMSFSHCAPSVDIKTMGALVHVESSNNPYAIGVVGGALPKQPRSKEEAMDVVAALERQGKNYSVGLAQVNKHNFSRYGITAADAFDACTNLKVGSLILSECYARALKQQPSQQQALRAAFSCYYSGNFARGFRPDKPGDMSYVDKVVAAAGKAALPTVPAIDDAALLPAATPAAAPLHANSVMAGDVESTSSIPVVKEQAVAVEPKETDERANDQPVRLQLGAPDASSFAATAGNDVVVF